MIDPAPVLSASSGAVSRAHPWRRRAAPPDVAAPAELRARVAAELERRAFARVAQHQPRSAPILERYAGPPSDRPLDVAIEAGVAMLLGEGTSSAIADTSTLVDLWVAVEGPGFALRALLAYEGPPLPIEMRYAPPDGPSPRRYFSHGVLGPWRRLRQRLTDVSDAAYASARDEASVLRTDLDLGRRCAIAYLFPLEAGWAREEISRCAAASGPDPDGHGALGALASSVDDGASLRKLLELAPSQRIPMLQDDHLFTAADRMGAAVLEAHRLLDVPSPTGAPLARPDVRLVLLDVYGGFRGRTVARAVSDFLSDGLTMRGARAVLARDPYDGIAALAESIAANPRRRRTFEPTLAELTSSYPGEAAQVLRYLDPHGAPGDDKVPGAYDALAPWVDGRDLFPKKGKKTKGEPLRKAWLDVASLPAPPGLSRDAVQTIVDALAKSRAGEHLARGAVVPPGTNVPSLEPLAWALVDAWSAAGGPASDAWVLRALAPLADGTGGAKRIAARVRAWANADAVRAAVLATRALAHADDPRVIVELDKLSAVGPEVHSVAARELDRVLEERGLTEEDLRDRRVSACGLDVAEAGKPVLLDFGSAVLEVRFDESMEPYLVDGHGERVKSAPRAARGAHAEKSAAAKEQWNDIKQALHDTVSTETNRLEEAMCTRRAWSARSFAEGIVQHPVLRRLAQRLVWADHGGDRRVAFRVAEDGSYADESDRAIELRGPIRLFHPLEMNDQERTAWGGVLADYNLIQPFQQLARDVYRLDPGEEREHGLRRYSGQGLSPKARFVLEARGWSLFDPDWQTRAERMVDAIHAATIVFSHGTIDSVSASVVLGSIDPIVLSEIIRDLERIRA